MCEEWPNIVLLAITVNITYIAKYTEENVSMILYNKNFSFIFLLIIRIRIM